MKRRPILKGFFLLALIAFFFFLSVFFLELLGKKGILGRENKVAVVEIKGVITDSGEIIEQLLKIKKDRKIKALVLRIDSPGAEVASSQEIYEEVKKLKKEKKVVASMGSVAASGGYYIASPAHKIIANPGTITGSIGVILQFANVEELLKKIGMKGVVIKSGELKDIMSPFREITNKEKVILQGVIDNIHNQFVEAVAKERGLSKEKVFQIADGRIFSGEQAKNLGLVDELGNLQDAIDTAAKLVGIKGEPEVIYPEKRRFSLLDLFFQKMVKNLTSLLLLLEQNQLRLPILNLKGGGRIF